VVSEWNGIGVGVGVVLDAARHFYSYAKVQGLFGIYKAIKI